MTVDVGSDGVHELGGEFGVSLHVFDFLLGLLVVLLSLVLHSLDIVGLDDGGEHWESVGSVESGLVPVDVDSDKVDLIPWSSNIDVIPQ